jgi:hypothetical protein
MAINKQLLLQHSSVVACAYNNIFEPYADTTEESLLISRVAGSNATDFWAEIPFRATCI